MDFSGAGTSEEAGPRFNPCPLPPEVGKSEAWVMTALHFGQFKIVKLHWFWPSYKATLTPSQETHLGPVGGGSGVPDVSRICHNSSTTALSRKRNPCDIKPNSLSEVRTVSKAIFIKEQSTFILTYGYLCIHGEMNLVLRPEGLISKLNQSKEKLLKSALKDHR